MLAAVFVWTAHSQVYREPTVLSVAVKPALRHVLAAVSEQPGSLVLLADPDAGILTTARLLAGLELEQAALQPAPAPAALSVMGIFVRAMADGSAEVYAHSSLLVMATGETHLQFLSTTGHPETQLLAALNLPAKPAPRPSRVLPMPANGVWDALRRLEAQGVIEARFATPDLGVATVVRWGQRTVTIATLFVEELSPTATRLKANAVVLSTPECLPVPHGKAAPATALLEMIAGGGGPEAVAKPAGSSAGFCALLAESAELIPLYRIRSNAAKKSVAADVESVWSALLLVVRQFAVVTTADKARRRIQYEAPCSQNPQPEPREKRFERLIRPKPGCTVAVWLGPRQSETDVFAAFSIAEPDGWRRLGMLLDQVAMQLFAEKQLRHVTHGKRP